MLTAQRLWQKLRAQKQGQRSIWLGEARSEFNTFQAKITSLFLAAGRCVNLVLILFLCEAWSYRLLKPNNRPRAKQTNKKKIHEGEYTE